MKSFIFKSLTLVIVFSLLILLIIKTFIPPSSSDVILIDEWTLTESETISEIILPTTIDISESRTKVTLTATVDMESGNYLYFKTVYAPVKVYINDILSYEYGEENTSSVFLDPPTNVTLVKLPTSSDDTVDLRFEFLSPSQRDTLFLDSIIMGSASEIYSYLFESMGFSLLFGGVLVVLEIFLFFIGILVLRIPRASAAFFWLSLFSYNVGAWVICECNLTILLVGTPSILYVISYFSLFFIVYPIIQFSMITLNLHHTLPLKIISYVIIGFISVALILQLTSTMDLSRLLTLSHIINLFAFILLIALLIIDFLRYQNKLARNYLIPFFNLLLFSLLEIFNYYQQYLNVPKSFFIQIGILLFILYSAIILKSLAHESFNTQMENYQLSANLQMLTDQMNHQKNHYALMTEHASLLRRQRHDLRHQLSVIRHYNTLDNRSKINDYLDELSENIPTNTEIVFCKNEVINSVIVYYYFMAQKHHISTFDIHMQISDDIGKIYESDLCIIIGNLLENAIYACKDLENASIRIDGKKVQDFITLNMTNTCSVVKRNLSGTFRTTKKHGGIGLMSIESVVKKYDGTTKFEENKGVFTSFVYLSAK